MSVFIIAEAGVNHNGDIKTAFALCDKAKEIGANAIKFQTFITEKLILPNLALADYQRINCSSANDNIDQFKMLKKLEFSYETFTTIKKYCDSIDIEFMSTPDEEDSLFFLENLGVRRLKIGSGEIDNVPFLRKVVLCNLPIIISTGLANMSDVDFMMNVLLTSGLSRDNITILHCTTEYPAPFSDINLNAMISIKKRFQVAVGYSDHSLGIEVPIAAVSLGASIIEKHFTLDNDMPGPDHKASLEPKDFKKMVTAIRNIEVALGSEQKSISNSEIKNLNIIRKKIVSKIEIKKGDILDETNLTTKRSSNGISAKYWDLTIGKCSSRNYRPNQEIDELIR
ncbi:MAG: N-acetylneuraminate synthase [Oligoflexia bacterium]|nr:N-acetylneuraminate synthase [Oligoflexia bacterium]